MATIAEYSIAELSDLDVAKYMNVAEVTFVQSAQLAEPFIISPRLRKSLRNARTVTWETINGIQGAITSATTIGDDAAYTTPTETAYTASAAPYTKAVRADNFSQVASVVGLLDTGLIQFAQVAGQTWDYHAAVAMRDGAIAASHGFAVKSGETLADFADTAATDVLTLAHAKRAHALLTAQGAPPCMTPFGPLYVALVHPYAAYDLKAAAAGTSIFDGQMYLNSQGYQRNVLGVAGGFLWIECNTAALYSAGGGTGTVDAYYNMFLGADSIGKAGVGIPQTPTSQDFPITWLGPDSDFGGEDVGPDCVVRRSFPGSNLSRVTELGVLCHIGFGVVHPESLVTVVSGATLGIDGAANA